MKTTLQTMQHCSICGRQTLHIYDAYGHNHAGEKSGKPLSAFLIRADDSSAG
jgi:hypothetical protein